MAPDIYIYIYIYLEVVEMYLKPIGDITKPFIIVDLSRMYIEAVS